MRMGDQDYDRDQVLEWFKAMPGYRRLIRQRVSDARLAHYKADRRILRGREVDFELFGERRPNRETWNWRKDSDNLGQEIEGCG